MNKYEKMIHWFILFAFLGLCTTALAAEYFFSKEEILNSFKVSLPMVGASISPVDQFFISRIARRETWDNHLYFGIAFIIFLAVWIAINIIKRNKRYVLFKSIFFASAIAFCVSGIWMWLRLYIEVSETTFGLLKKVHYYAYWTFIITLISHIVMIVWLENNKKKGVLSNMINFKSVIFISLFSMSFFAENSQANNDLEKWVKDNNYINGVLYLEGEKGAEVLKKEVSNCPYEKCKLEDVNKMQFGTKTIEIKKPDFKKGIELLGKSSDDGNALASEKLLVFLSQRIDYKSQNPNSYLLDLMKEETGLSLNDYKVLINKVWKNGVKTNKSCYSQFMAGEIFEKGLLGNEKNNELSLSYYKKASEICPSNNINSHLAKSKLTNK